MLIRKIRMSLVLLIAGSIFASSSPPVQAQETSHTFPETGKSVMGRFLQYWNEHGGLAQQGYPISEVFGEISNTDGKLYTVQYFERAVFEYHPENSPPNDVLLSLLGVFSYQQNYLWGAPGQAANTAVGSRLFAETGHRVGGIFLQYWNSHGGLAQQGYPISDEFSEVSTLDGKTYAVQYFERAVFELHPENAAPNNVLLSQLGTFRFQANYSSVSALPPPPVAIPPASTGYTLYVASRGNWSIEYPSNWSAKDATPNYQFLEPSGKAFIQVTYAEGYGGPSNELLANIASEQFAVSFDNYHEYGRTEQSDGSYRLDFKFSVGGIDWDAQAFIEGRQGNVYLLILATTEDAYQEGTYEDIINHAIDSYSVPRIVTHAALLRRVW